MAEMTDMKDGMGEKLLNTLIATITAIIAVAIIAVIISRKSDTANVLQAGGNAFATVLKSAFASGYQGVTLGPVHFTVPQLPTINIGG